MERLRTGDERISKVAESSSSQTLQEVTFLTRSACAVRRKTRPRNAGRPRRQSNPRTATAPRDQCTRKTPINILILLLDSDFHRPDSLKPSKTVRPRAVLIHWPPYTLVIRGSRFRPATSSEHGWSTWQLPAQSLEIIGYEPIPSLPAL
jgi:hypothetical protein